ncbi:GspH/FimT family pseudopilin [Ideonella sp. 4Y16]|uniref:Type II secretion system protein H n=1 Tax=Ideonella alba TaxID=2824118 RepID=A0A940YHA7_9BURK|nr:GspH/FimT family pseudopilin [Ideonella alba]MBQ0933356.1 GspH/FimT family pseudopilin [Ideonella alba]MBQ0943957.1 GspH/FimT family pseudopilin [Ideonella alba]
MVELAVTLVVLAALVMSAVPFMRDFVGGRIAESQAEELVSSLRQARSEAMKRLVEVSVCAGKNLTTDNAECSGSRTWSQGWISFVDYNNNGIREAGEPVLRVFAGPAGLKAADGSVQSLTLARTGILLRADGAALTNDAQSWVRFAPNTGSDRSARTICVNRQGRVALLKGAGACA